MDPFEDRIRTALLDRGGDVEPTPHLYRQVQRRITRRRRRVAWTLAPAGVAVLAAVAVPLVLSGGPQVPTIADLADRPGAVSAGGAAELVVVDAAGAPAVLDLASGERAPLGEGGQPGEVTGDVEVRLAPGARDVPPRPVVRTSSPDSAAEEGAERTVVHLDGERLEVPTSTAGPAEVVPAGGLTVSPDAAWVASLVRGEDADGWAVQLSQIPATPGETLETVELDLVLPGGSRLQDWTATDPDLGASRLAVRDPDGRILHLPVTVAAGGVPVWEGEIVEVAVEEPVAAYADDHLGGWVTVADGRLTHVQPVDGDRPAAGAVTLDEGRVVTGVDVVDGEVRTEVDVAALTEGADRVALRALGTTTVLTTDAGTWWLERGEDGWREPVRIESGAVDAVPVGRDLAAAETPGAPEAGPDAPAPDATPEGEVGPSLGDGLVVADDTTVSLIGADGTREELYTFPAEGESTIVDVAVRPGSTADDLTVLITTRAEGMFDLRWLRATEGSPATPQLIDVGGFPLAAVDLGVPPTPAWSPDGDLVAVVAQIDDDGPVELRTLGWDDDGPSADPNLAATFALDTDRAWSVTGWIWTDGADGEVARSGQLVLLDPLGATSALLELERQGDGAVALAPDAGPTVRGEGDLALAVGGGRGPGGLDAELLRDEDGTVTLRLWRWTDPEGGTGTDVVEVDVSDLAGPREGRVLAGWPEGVLMALDPAEPRVVDRTSGEVTEPPFPGEVVTADALR